QEVFSLNLTDILAGLRPDFVLENNDEIFISSSFDLKEQGTMTISGMVANPGEYPFAENTTIEDFIIMAGGLLDGASTSRVDVTRRKKDANGMVATSDIGELYSFSLENGLADTGERTFVLEPYDEVMVHRSPSYNIQRHFTVEGEVNFPGSFSLTSRQERVSDLVKKAGGLTEFAFMGGAHITRIATPEELEIASKMVEVVEAQLDTTQTDAARKAIVTTYAVSIDLEAALTNPGGDADVILREGDVLNIPSLNNVIRIHGAVRFPTAVNYNQKMNGRAYIEEAGGFAKNALRSKGYVVDMSGRAKRFRNGMKIEPGSEIYIPAKEKVKEREFNPQILLAVAQSAASMGTLAVAVYSIIRNASSK
ncbi:MAG: SLBB domain-containing protein, partial [Bacteroidales bacterium]|nr:SLBB domain-containing protein [Bacteroidales bacterium]